MGLLLLCLFLVDVIFLAVPTLIIGISITKTPDRPRGFWRVCGLTALVSFLVQYLWAADPLRLFRSGEYTLDLVISPLFGLHLFATPLLALFLWDVWRRDPYAYSPAIRAGLLFSVTAVVVLSVPVGCAVTSLLGLQFRP